MFAFRSYFVLKIVFFNIVYIFPVFSVCILINEDTDKETWIVITTLLKQQIEWWPNTFTQYCIFSGFQSIFSGFQCIFLCFILYSQISMYILRFSINIKMSVNE